LEENAIIKNILFYAGFFLYLLGPMQAAAQPDLVLTAVSTKTTAITPGKTLSLSNAVQNQGDMPAGSFLIVFHLSTNTTYGDGDDVIIADMRNVKSLKAGAAGKATTKATIPLNTPVGTYHLCVIADEANAVAESNESNNTLCTAGQVLVSQPDLVLTALAPTTAVVSSKAALSIAATVKNQGPLPAGRFEIEFNLSPTADYTDPGAVAIQTTRKVNSLKAGVDSAATTKLTIPLNTPAGSYYICAKADPVDSVLELDENNNTQCSAGPVSVPASDLILTAVSTTAPAITPGETLSVSSTARNQGGFLAGSFLIAFHLSTNTTYGDGDDIVITATRNVKSLGAGANSTGKTKLTIPIDIPSASYYICAMADSEDAAPESDETNNARCSGQPIPTKGFWGSMSWGFGIW
jgi:subtilase family serine protease